MSAAVVKLGKYKGLEVNRIPVEVTEEELTAALEGLRRDYAQGQEIDDDLAKSLFGFESLDALKAALREQLWESAAADAKIGEENAAVDAAVLDAEIILPEELVEAEVQREFAVLNEKMQQNGMNMDQYLAYMNVTRDEYLAQARPNVEQQLKVRALLDAVAMAEGIVITEDELNAELAKLAESFSISAEEIRNRLGDLNPMRRDLAAQKAMDIVVQSAVRI